MLELLLNQVTCILQNWETLSITTPPTSTITIYMDININMSTSYNSSKVESCEKKKPCILSCFTSRFLPTIFLLSAAFLIGSAFVVTDYKERLLRVAMVVGDPAQSCVSQQRLVGTEKLPRGILRTTTELEMRPLWGHSKKNSKKSMNLLAMAVGVKQKESVDKIVRKFPTSDFVVMLFHYDGILDEWKDLEWIHHVIHVAAINQTKWWFAKRFLHPDIVLEYDYIFLWDEDLGVEHFNAGRYVSIIREEGLEISQPALEANISEVHHKLTRRQPNRRVHRWVDAKIGPTSCNRRSRGPPCTGFVEMMAPVFSRASWRCVWHMIQNDLVHAWGLDFQLGYCAQGDRTKNIGIVDSEYVIHYGIPTLGGSATSKEQSSSEKNPSGRTAVRQWSFVELEMFKNRWKKAVNDDKFWNDPFKQS